MFICVVLWLIARAHAIPLWKLLAFLKEEFLIVLGTSSSEPALPGLMRKLEQLGCSKSVVGLVIPSGYSFNLDGTSIYLTIAALFVAQATNTRLSAGEEFTLLLVLSGARRVWRNRHWQGTEGHGETFAIGAGRVGPSNTSNATRRCIHVVPHLGGVLITMSPGRKVKPCQRELSATTER